MHGMSVIHAPPPDSPHSSVLVLFMARYAHAKEMAARAKLLEKERQEQKERDKRKDGEARVKQKAADKSRTIAAHERQV